MHKWMKVSDGFPDKWALYLTYNGHDFQLCWFNPTWKNKEFRRGGMCLNTITHWMELELPNDKQ